MGDERGEDGYYILLRKREYCYGLVEISCILKLPWCVALIDFITITGADEMCYVCLLDSSYL